MSFGGEPYGETPYGGAYRIPSGGTGTLTMVGFADEQFGTTDMGGGLPPATINPPGFIDEHFGTTTLGGGVILTAPPGFSDEQFGPGVFLYPDVLSIFYGPLPTPLIADAPYSQGA